MGLASSFSHSLFGFAEAVAEAAHGLDQAVDAEFLPQRLDVNVDGPFQDDRPLADGGVHELVAREGPTRLAQHALQQAELRRRQLQLAALDVGPVPDPVDPDAEVLDSVGSLTAALGPALNGLDALEQDLDVKRLGDVVIAA